MSSSNAAVPPTVPWYRGFSLAVIVVPVLLVAYCVGVFFAARLLLPSTEDMLFLAVFAGACLAGALVSVLILMKLVVTPIRRVGREARAAGTLAEQKEFADLSATPVGSHGGEIDEFAAAFNSITTELKKNQANLEKVTTLSREIEDHLLATSKMKFEQDGDYFLTAQLIKPLGGNFVRSDSVSVEYYLLQKKQFRFKKWDGQLGGDLCVAHTFQLSGRNCTVFLNADAMGKSLQGAGGVLVLGSIFEANMERSKISLEVQSQTPELWIKHSLVELQRVFESFDATMLISLVLGVIDDRTGTMYYINAEHPGMALYRDGRANFIEDDDPLQKIGYPDVNDRHVKIQVFPLQHGDVLLIGSDGRDDLLIGTDEEGDREINADDSLFLRHVETADGRLEGIVSEIRKVGQLTDDLSLMRVSYGEGQALPKQPPQKFHDLLAEARKLASGDSPDYEAVLAKLEEAGELLKFGGDGFRTKLHKHMAKAYYKLGRHAEAADSAEKYLDDFPHDTDFLYAGARILLGDRRYETAADWCERYRLRRPESWRNLRLLSKILAKLGNAGRALVMEKESEAMETMEMIKAQQADGGGQLIG